MHVHFLQLWSYKLKWEIVSFPFMKRKEPSSSSCGDNKWKAAPEFELCLCIDSSGNKWAEPKWQNKRFKFSEEVASYSRRKEAGVSFVVEGLFRSFTLCCCFECVCIIESDPCISYANLQSTVDNPYFTVVNTERKSHKLEIKQSCEK